jgi:rRNA maturation protein Nop10
MPLNTFDITRWCGRSLNSMVLSTYTTQNTSGNDSNISARSRYSQIVRHGKYRNVTIEQQAEIRKTSPTQRIAFGQINTTITR